MGLAGGVHDSMGLGLAWDGSDGWIGLGGTGWGLVWLWMVLARLDAADWVGLDGVGYISHLCAQDSALGWVLEMWGYALSAARMGLKHPVVKERNALLSCTPSSLQHKPTVPR